MNAVLTGVTSDSEVSQSAITWLRKSPCHLDILEIPRDIIIWQLVSGYKRTATFSFTFGTVWPISKNAAMKGSRATWADVVYMKTTAWNCCDLKLLERNIYVVCACLSDNSRRSLAWAGGWKGWTKAHATLTYEEPLRVVSCLLGDKLLVARSY